MAFLATWHFELFPHFHRQNLFFLCGFARENLHDLFANPERIPRSEQKIQATCTFIADQADYLETLAELSAAYESARCDASPSQPPHEFLAAHLENIGMTASEWGRLIGIDRSTASRLLRGERKLNTAHIKKTAKALHLAAAQLI